MVSRRSLFVSTAYLLVSRLSLPAWIDTAQAQEQERWRHGICLFGQLKYPAGFKQFDYVNAAAPNGGVVRQSVIGTFDNFNVVIAGMKGSVAAGIDLIYDTLLATSLDELASDYGLLAESVKYPSDFSSATYRLRAEAKWHDGTSIKPRDVIFSYEVFKKYNPQFSAKCRQVAKVEQTGDREINFTFDGPGNRDLPQVIGQLTVLPEHWWNATDKNGQQRDIGATTLEPPLGSGPYRITEFSPGRDIAYERVKDYWGRTVNVNVGRNNFDALQYRYFRDPTIALEAFKTGSVDWRTENSAKNWATGYDFPAVRDKRVLLEEFPIRNIGIMQGFAFNLRRDKFQDPRVRLAFNYAFDFDQMNKQLFYGQYQRIVSYFEGSTEFAASGVPAGRELELLEPLRDAVPAELFARPYANPTSGSPESVRKNLRESVRLFKEAGYEVHDHRLVGRKTGQPYAVELLTADPNFVRVFLHYKPALERIGIDVTVRTVDQVQYENRLRTWDFDIISAAWATTLPPGNEQRAYWGSQAAETPGSLNLIGIKNPAVDAMIEHVSSAKTWADLEAAAKALDRVLLWNYYVVPQWTYSKIRTARWDRFDHADPMPKYGRAAFPMLWWWDAKKAAKA